MPPLNPVEKKVLKIVIDYYQKNGHPCSQLFIANKRKVSPSTTYDTIERLISKGYLSRPRRGLIIPTLVTTTQ